MMRHMASAQAPRRILRRTVAFVFLLGGLTTAVASGVAQGRAAAAPVAKEVIATCNANLGSEFFTLSDIVDFWDWNPGGTDGRCVYGHPDDVFYYPDPCIPFFGLIQLNAVCANGRGPFQSTVSYLFTHLDLHTRYQVYVSFGSLVDAYYNEASGQTCDSREGCDSEDATGFVSSYPNPTPWYLRFRSFNPANDQGQSVALQLPIVPAADGADGGVVNLTMTYESDTPADTHTAFAPQKAWVEAVGPVSSPPAPVRHPKGAVPYRYTTWHPSKKGGRAPQPSARFTGGTVSPVRSGGGGHRSLH